jgi:hypothetical protein
VGGSSSLPLSTLLTGFNWPGVRIDSGASFVLLCNDEEPKDAINLTMELFHGHKRRFPNGEQIPLCVEVCSFSDKMMNIEK